MQNFQICFWIPETKPEFTTYYRAPEGTLLGTTIRQLRDIRHHQLPALLRYSGEEIRILRDFGSEWDLVKDWNPEMRYDNRIIRKAEAANFVNAVKIMTRAIYRYFCVNIDSMAKKNQHVVPLGNGWAVKSEGSSRVTVIATKQSDAIHAAKTIAKNSETELIIHGRDGRIRERNSYGNDPNPPKG